MMTTLAFLLPLLIPTLAFSPTPAQKSSPHVLSLQRHRSPTIRTTTSPSTRLHLFDLEKAFEEEGPLGKGITVGKLQIALNVNALERTSKDSIFAILEENARAGNDEDDDGFDDDYEDGYGDSHLSQMCHQVCLALLRKSDDWIAACSESKWFKGDDYGKAESLYNQWADREAAKFEKVRILLLFCLFG